MKLSEPQGLRRYALDCYGHEAVPWIDCGMQPEAQGCVVGRVGKRPDLLVLGKERHAGMPPSRVRKPLAFPASGF